MSADVPVAAELRRPSARELAALVAARQASSREVVQAVQLIGSRHREDLCLDAAQALEDRLGTITPIDSR